MTSSRLPVSHASLPVAQIADLLAPYLNGCPPQEICERVSAYLDLLARWSRRVSLTSLREPAAIVQRHFGESFFLAERLPACEEVLDVGSGAGFPGIPVALLRPACRVVLAESQQKKAAFLREAVDVLHLPQVRVYAGRVEDMLPAGTFDVVTLRAVDRMREAMAAGTRHLKPQGTLAFFSGQGTPALPEPANWEMLAAEALPLTGGSVVLARRR